MKSNLFYSNHFHECCCSISMLFIHLNAERNFFIFHFSDAFYDSRGVVEARRSHVTDRAETWIFYRHFIDYFRHAFSFFRHPLVFELSRCEVRVILPPSFMNSRRKIFKNYLFLTCLVSIRIYFFRLFSTSH